MSRQQIRISQLTTSLGKESRQLQRHLHDDWQPDSDTVFITIERTSA
jgi:hypothetical protein